MTETPLASAATRHLPTLLSLYIAFVFIQSLFFKYADATETQLIFGTLEIWFAGWSGIEGVFAPGGIFSAKVIATVELLASVLLLTGLFVPRLRVLQFAGAVLALAVISGAIFFHLFTPLGIIVGDEQVPGVATGDLQSDGGLLFFMAVGVWLASVVLIGLHRDRWLPLVQRLRGG